MPILYSAPVSPHPQDEAPRPRPSLCSSGPCQARRPRHPSRKQSCAFSHYFCTLPMSVPPLRTRPRGRGIPAANQGPAKPGDAATLTQNRSAGPSHYGSLLFFLCPCLPPPSGRGPEAEALPLQLKALPSQEMPLPSPEAKLGSLTFPFCSSSVSASCQPQDKAPRPRPFFRNSGPCQARRRRHPPSAGPLRAVALRLCPQLTPTAAPPRAQGASVVLGGDEGMAGADGAAARLLVLGAAMPQGWFLRTSWGAGGTPREADTERAAGTRVG